MNTDILRKLLIVLPAVSSAVLAQDLVGDWQGLLMNRLHVIVHIKKPADGPYRASLESPDQGGGEIAAEQVEINADHLQFSIAKIHGHYDGRWNDATKAWTGTWTQGSANLPLELRRNEGAPLAVITPLRPQEKAIADGPLPYTQQNVSFENPSAKIRLAGTFSAPNGKGPFPTVVLVSGSGPNTRDEEVYRHKIFLVLADHLNRHGIAVLRYDKRGIGKSEGNYKGATTTDFVDDADAAVRYLKTRDDVDTAHIGLIGHSEGGLIVPAVALRNADASFIAMLAGPGIRGDQLLIEQGALISRATGISEQTIAQNRINSKTLFDAIQSAPNPTDARQRARDIFDSFVKSGQIDKTEANAQLDRLTSPWFLEFLTYDPIPALAKLTIPVLAINGSLDLQVPADQDLPPIREALKTNKKATVLELPGLNHLFQTAKTGSPTEYSQIEETMSPKALNTVSEWVLAQSK